MLVLPVDEDTWIFHACLYVGMALMVLDVVLPRLFRRRVRLVVPPMAQVLPPLPRPTKVMTKAQFRRKKRELQKTIRALERGEDGCADVNVDEGVFSAVETASEREEDRQNHRSEQRKSKKLVKKPSKKASRVVMQGDRDVDLDEEQKENDVYVAPPTSRSASKRVSFDMTDDVSYREPQQQSTRRQATPSPSYESTAMATGAEETMATTASATKTTTRATASLPHEKANTNQSDAVNAPPSRRPDPFSLVDDAFPWQLPNYATMATTATTAATATATATNPQVHSSATLSSQPAITLNVRRPFGPFNSISSTSTLSAATTLELKHRPLWKRSTREPSAAASTSQSPLATSSSQSPPQAATTSTTTTAALAHDTSSQPAPHTSAEPPPRPSFSSVPFQKWRVPSPKPPLPPRQAAASTTTTSAMETTPVAPPAKLRTPKIIRRITFDEDMMGLLATPSDVSPFITDTTRKRQRDQDVLEALDAVGLPWHKRRLHNSGD